MVNEELKKMNKNKVTIVLDHTPDKLNFHHKILGASIVCMRRGDAINELNQFEEKEEVQ